MCVREREKKRGTEREKGTERERKRDLSTALGPQSHQALFNIINNYFR